MVKLRVCFSSILLLLCAGNLISAPNRIAGNIDRTRSVRLQARSAGIAQLQDDLGAVDPGMALDELTLLLNPGCL